MMKCIQFTDIHVGLEGEYTHDVDVRANLHRILEAIGRERPDVVVLTGDLCFKDPLEEIYIWLVQIFEEHQINPLIIPGNHDDRMMVRRHFNIPGTSQKQIYYAQHWEGFPVLFLDTSDATMEEDQWTWLEQQLGKADGDVLIFMHHPPVVMGIPFMDRKHVFQQDERFLKLMERFDQEVHVFCGHYHVERTLTNRVVDMHVHITPSCFFQISEHSEEFSVDHYRIGYRTIELSERNMVHAVRYVDGLPLKLSV